MIDKVLFAPSCCLFCWWRRQWRRQRLLHYLYQQRQQHRRGHRLARPRVRMRHACGFLFVLPGLTNKFLILINLPRKTLDVCPPTDFISLFCWVQRGKNPNQLNILSGLDGADHRPATIGLKLQCIYNTLRLDYQY